MTAVRDLLILVPGGVAVLVLPVGVLLAPGPRPAAHSTPG